MAKYIYDRWLGYTAADCDCRYCLYYGGRRKGKVKCLAVECVCKEELQETARMENKIIKGEIENDQNCTDV